ncbi:hypothetical protein [Variovorax terrae]|uniref:Uncharacterized protein n=1 Tax=Variovorax terrae TaxID=2923278 RepID=A0A9X2ASH1_9BURK|nr:hypothetical protein [Variovorax terrae]MCJ0765351.1 hypothetical protein [Variovorax terrae]
MDQNALLRNGRLQPIKVVSEEEAGPVILRAQASPLGKFLTNQHLVLTKRYLVFGKQHLFAATHYEEMTWIPLGWIRPGSVGTKGLFGTRLVLTLADGTSLDFKINSNVGPSAKTVAGAIVAALCI